MNLLSHKKIKDYKNVASRTMRDISTSKQGITAAECIEQWLNAKFYKF
jgi:hypothetical protein